MPTTAIQMPPSALFAGYLSSLCFTLQYVPQMVLNYRRRSVSGLSTSGIIIKLVGACFLCVNSYLTGEHLSVVMYGTLNVVQHLVFVSQFATYTGDRSFMLWFLFPLLPLCLGTALPESIALTSSFKPVSQLLSHLPQLYLTWTKRTAEGVSLSTQHLNLVGGLSGLYMASLVPTKSIWTSMVYVFSIFQVVSLYALVIYFDGLDSLIQSFPFMQQSNPSSPSHDAVKFSNLSDTRPYSPKSAMTPPNMSIVSHEMETISIRASEEM